MADTTPDTIDNTGTSLVPRLTSDVIIANLQGMIDALPEAGEGDELAIVSQIISAGRVEDLDRPWSSEGIAKFYGRQIQINAVKRRPSDFQDGFGAYLVLEVMDLDTGEVEAVTTGSSSIVAQLAQAYRLVGLPITCIPRVATRPTSNGYYPQHLERIRSAL